MQNKTMQSENGNSSSSIRVPEQEGSSEKKDEVLIVLVFHSNSFSTFVFVTVRYMTWTTPHAHTYTHMHAHAADDFLGWHDHHESTLLQTSSSDSRVDTALRMRRRRPGGVSLMDADLPRGVSSLAALWLSNLSGASCLT